MYIKNEFSKEALNKIFEYYSNLESRTENQIEFDINSISDDWVEFSNDELITEFECILDNNIRDYKSKLDYIINELDDFTTVIRLDNGIVMKDFD